MDANFNTVIRQLGAEGINRLARAPLLQDADYLGPNFLPTQQRNSYDVKGGNIKVTGTLAPTIPMDTPFPEGGFIGMSTLTGSTAKFGLSVTLPEKTLRDLRGQLDAIQLGRAGAGASKIDLLTRTLINFITEMIVRPHEEQREYMRMQAITEGKIKVTSNRSKIDVDYGIPAGNKLAKRTGTAAYGRNASVFFADMAKARRTVGASLATVMHLNTLEQILLDPTLVVVAEDYSPDRKTRRVSVRKAAGASVFTPTGFNQDVRSTFDLIGYGKEGQLLDLANPGQTIAIPFINPGRIAVIGDAIRRELLPQAEGTPANALGFLHEGPTEEGDGNLGRWSRVYTPESRPMQVRAEGCENVLPVFDAPERVFLLDTEIDP
jgi:hypothetical protein